MYINHQTVDKHPEVTHHYIKLHLSNQADDLSMPLEIRVVPDPVPSITACVEYGDNFVVAGYAKQEDIYPLFWCKFAKSEKPPTSEQRINILTYLALVDLFDDPNSEIYHQLGAENVGQFEEWCRRTFIPEFTPLSEQVPQKTVDGEVILVKDADSEPVTKHVWSDLTEKQIRGVPGVSYVSDSIFRGKYRVCFDPRYDIDATIKRIEELARSEAAKEGKA